MSGADLSMRLATIEDLPDLLALAGGALGWNPADPNAEFFTWKHFENPAGASAMWVACDGDEVVGLRAFLRWRWRTSEGSVVESVRAVDTATDSRYRGRGIFTELTLHGVQSLRDEGVGFVFNTPNSASRPGYLKMGWRELGRVPLAVRPRGVRGLMKMASARTAAHKWSELSTLGVPAAEIFVDRGREDLEALIGSQPRPGGFSTERSVEFLRWRYGFEALGYRIFTAADDLDGGFVAYRARRRGGAVEVAVCDVLVPGADPDAERRLIRSFAEVVGGDYLAMVTTRSLRSSGALRMPRLGPVMTWRALAQSHVPRMGDFELTLGDVELF